VSEEYLSFEKVLRELQIEENELKRLVSAGEIKAYRDADQMRFRLDDVQKLKKHKGSDSEPDVIELLDADETSGDSAPTAELGSEELTEELSFDDEDFDAGLDLGAKKKKSDDLLSEDLGEDRGADEVDLGSMDLEEQEIAEEAEEDVGASAAGRTRIRKTKIAGVEEAPEEAEPQWALGAMIASALFLLIGVLVMVDIATGSPSPLVGWLVGMFGE